MCVCKYCIISLHFYVVIKSSNIIKVSNKGCHVTVSEIGDADPPLTPPTCLKHQKHRLSFLHATENIGILNDKDMQKR